jgi:hypothetical protein
MMALSSILIDAYKLGELLVLGSHDINHAKSRAIIHAHILTEMYKHGVTA